MPNSIREGYARASSLRRTFLYRNGEKPNISSQFAPSSIAASSPEVMPAATPPPMSPPMLVPAIRSIGMRCSSNQRTTPTCARPRALPPPNATPIRGRCCAAG